MEAGERVNRSPDALVGATLLPGATFPAMVSILTISGMVAVHSKRAIFTALAGVPGITSAQVELGRAVIDHDERATEDAMTAAVESVGCSVVAIERGSGRSLPVFGASADSAPGD